MPATEVYKPPRLGLVSVGTLKRAKKMLRVRSCRRSCRIVNDGKARRPSDGCGNCLTTKTCCARTGNG